MHCNALLRLALLCETVTCFAKHKRAITCNAMDAKVHKFAINYNEFGTIDGQTIENITIDGYLGPMYDRV